MLNSALVQNIFILVLLFLLGISIFFGIRAGIDVARTRLVTANALALAQGLDYFYADQNRYPTEVEYADQNSMGQYFNYYPVIDFISEQCSESYFYSNDSQKTYELQFCVPRTVDGVRQGWNQLQ